MHAASLGGSMSRRGGSSAPRAPSGSRLVELDLERGIAVGEHEGYTRLADPVRHVRSVLAPPGAPLVVIVDRLEAEGRHEYAQTWPLHPELAARLTTEGVVEVKHEG